MSGNGSGDEPGQFDDDESNYIWDAVDSNQQRFWKLDARYQEQYKDDATGQILPQMVKIDDNYVQLTKKDIELNRFTEYGTTNRHGAVYISNSCFSRLKAKDFPFANTGGAVPVRTRYGSPALVEAVKKTVRGKDPNKLTENLPWSNYFNNGVKATSIFVPLRFVNPNIDVILRPLHTSSTQITVNELQAIVDANKKYVKQNVTISTEPKVASLEAKGFIMLDIDPFGYYQTWIRKSDLKDYLLTRVERPMASQAALDAALKNLGMPILGSRNSKKQRTDHKLSTAVTPNDLRLVVYLNNFKQFRAIGKKRFQQQDAVMGTSATEVAAAYKWTTPRSRISDFKTNSGVKWDIGYFPAEWLHKSAFSWGGLNDDGANVWDSSQVPKNLIFGTSETNSVMIRTERAWQGLFDAEASLYRKLEPNIQDTEMTQRRKKVKGTLTLKAAIARDLKDYRSWDAGSSSLIRYKSVGPPTFAAQNRWLWYSFEYNLNLAIEPRAGRPRSLLLGANRLLTTEFYSFQRLFYLSIQSRVDRAILSTLQDKAVSRNTAQPQTGAIHLVDATSAFISRPIPLRLAVRTFNPERASQGRGDDVFNTNALMAALLASSNEPPVTADIAAARTLVDSTAPQNMSHANLWQSALGEPILHVDGVAVSNPGIATIDADGHLVEVSTASMSSSDPGIHVTRIPATSALRIPSVRPTEFTAMPLALRHGLSGGALFDNSALQDNPGRATPPGYVLTGDIQLFGILPAKIYTFQGTASDGGVHEIVTIANDLPLDTLFPDFPDTDFRSINLQNVQLRYNDRALNDDDLPPGTWLEGDMTFQGALQPIADVLQSTFHQADPKLHVEFLVGMDRNWNTLEMPSDFTISGSFAGISVNFADLVQFTTLGVKIHVNKKYDPAPYREHFALNFGLFGEALVTVPGSIVPLHMDFTMELNEAIIDLSMVLRDDAWNNAFGIEGLSLSSIELSTNFDAKAPPRTIGFEVGALLLNEMDLISLRGYYTQGDWGLDATLYDLDLESFLNCFWSFFGGEVDEFDDDIEFSTVVLSIDPTGISLEGTLSVNGYEAVEGSMGIDREGFTIAGAIADTNFGDLALKQAALDVFIGAGGVKKASRRPFQIAIKGTVEFQGVNVAVSVYTSKSPKEGLLFTVYGEYNALLDTGMLAPELQGTFLDIPMKRVALLAGNTNTPAPGFVNKYNYPLIKGVQICAQIDSIPALNSATGVVLDGLTLRVGLAARTGLQLDIDLPTDKAPALFMFVTLRNWKPPSLQVAVTGGLMIGSTSATVSLAVGPNPSEELISASLESLSSNDLIAFASDVLEQDIPKIDEEVFQFEAVSFSISTGVRVGTTFTPPGATFAGTIDLFGHKATMEAFVRNEIKISGTFEAFALGPLAVTGAQGPNPKFDFELGPRRQSLLLDGAAKLLELETSLHVEATLLPKPAFKFDMFLAFTELLPLTLHGAMLGALDIKDVSKLDFELSATLEQKILDYLMTQANLQFVAAEKGAKEGFDAAREKLGQIEAAFQRNIDVAQAQLNTAQVAWNAKQKSVKAAFDTVKESTQAQQATLQSQLDIAQAALNHKIDEATRSLEQTRVNAAAAIKAAQDAVLKSTIDGDASVAQHQADYNKQKKSVDAKFGDARQSVQNAQDSVQAAQSAADDTDQKLAVAQQNFNNASVFNKPKFAAQIAALQTERGSRYAALKTAQGVLSAAQSALDGLGYKAALAALKAYQESLDAAVQASNAAISAANATLASTATAQNNAIAAATTALNTAKKSSAESAAFSAANKAMQEFLSASAAAIATAQAAVDNLASTTEGVAFTAATNALNFAKNNTADLDIARHALDTAQAAAAIALDVSKWMVNHVGNFVNLTLVQLSGTLRGLVDLGQPMKARVKGLIASSAFDYTIDYSLGRTPELVKSVFEKVWADLNAKIIQLPV
ncbi:MAG: hypothetical protein M1816_001511 [Peltula sp. TS41687]|nr:MAG: hypothetical protein M1816_001511 [Peltula sp. TS41687]